MQREQGRPESQPTADDAFQPLLTAAVVHLTDEQLKIIANHISTAATSAPTAMPAQLVSDSDKPTPPRIQVHGRG